MKIAGTQARPPASAERRKSLEVVLPPGLLVDYLTFFERCDGADIWFDDVDWTIDQFDYLRLASVEEMLNPKTREAHRELFPDLFVIGSDGGSQVLAFDMTRPPPWPIVMHLPGFSTAENRSVIATSMRELMETYLE